jgi:S-adenosylmethionine hydrolase
MKYQFENCPIITLTTDFGWADYYVGCMKGVILSINPNVNIIDISHEIKPYDIIGCSYFLSSFYKYYPLNTINVVVVDPGVGSSRKPLLIKADEYYFIGPDNGIFSAVLDSADNVEIYHLTNSYYFSKFVSSTFHGRDIFAPVSAYLSLNTPVSKFGEKIKNINTINNCKPVVSQSKIIGSIIYEDRFGNLITNIKRELVQNIEKIVIGKVQIDKIRNTYSEVTKGDLLAIIGSSGYLEISANMDSAARIIDRSSEVVCFLN